MNGKRKRHAASFKAKFALEAAKQTRTVAELAKVCRGHPTTRTVFMMEGARTTSAGCSAPVRDLSGQGKGGM